MQGQAQRSGGKDKALGGGGGEKVAEVKMEMEVEATKRKEREGLESWEIAYAKEGKSVHSEKAQRESNFSNARLLSPCGAFRLLIRR